MRAAGCWLLERERSREAGCGSSPGPRQLPRSTMVCARVAPWRGACYGQGEETATCGFSHPAWPLPVRGLRAVWKCAPSEDHLTCETNARKCRWRSVRASVGRENWCHHYLARQQDAGAAAGSRGWQLRRRRTRGFRRRGPSISTVPRAAAAAWARRPGARPMCLGRAGPAAEVWGSEGGATPHHYHTYLYTIPTHTHSPHPTPHCSRIRVATLLVQCTRVPVWVNVGFNKLTSGQNVHFIPAD